MSADAGQGSFVTASGDRETDLRERKLARARECRNATPIHLPVSPPVKANLMRMSLDQRDRGNLGVENRNRCSGQDFPNRRKKTLLKRREAPPQKNYSLREVHEYEPGLVKD